MVRNIIKTTVREMLEEEIQKTIDNDRTQSQQTAIQKSPNSTPPTAKFLKKDTLLTMLTEIIEHSGADEVNCFSQASHWLTIKWQSL